MRVLLDTNILIWAIAEPKKLSLQARQEIEQASVIYVSSASIWEISIKSSLGKIEINLEEMLERLDEMDVEPLAIQWSHARVVKELPFYHHDPFDRILVAQAISEPMTLLTHDELLLKYSSELVKLV
jgi:PIN domain nuclease of toxin-antitoxin system